MLTYFEHKKNGSIGAQKGSIAVDDILAVEALPDTGANLWFFEV